MDQIPKCLPCSLYAWYLIYGLKLKKLLEENIGDADIHMLRLDNGFLDKIPKTHISKHNKKR